MDEMMTVNSAYLKEDYLKRKFVYTWEELCHHQKITSTIEIMNHEDKAFSGTPYPEINRRVQRVLRADEFPDHMDIVELVERCNTKYGLGIGATQKLELSRNVFKEVGRIIKCRRTKDFSCYFGSHLTDAFKAESDPAVQDSHLLERLTKNMQAGKAKLETLCEEFVVKQEQENEREEGVTPPEDSSSSDDERREEEDEDELEHVGEEHLSGLESGHESGLESEHESGHESGHESDLDSGHESGHGSEKELDGLRSEHESDGLNGNATKRADNLEEEKESLVIQSEISPFKQMKLKDALRLKDGNLDPATAEGEKEMKPEKRHSVIADIKPAKRIKLIDANLLSAILSTTKSISTGAEPKTFCSSYSPCSSDSRHVKTVRVGGEKQSQLAVPSSSSDIILVSDNEVVVISDTD